LQIGNHGDRSQHAHDAKQARDREEFRRGQKAERNDRQIEYVPAAAKEQQRWVGRKKTQRQLHREEVQNDPICRLKSVPVTGRYLRIGFQPDDHRVDQYEAGYGVAELWRFDERSEAAYQDFPVHGSHKPPSSKEVTT
jgi:hypothetical protein